MARRKRERRLDYAQISHPEDRAALLRLSGAPQWLIARAQREARPNALRALGNPQRRREKARPISHRGPYPSAAAARP